MKIITEIFRKKILYYKKMEKQVNKEDHYSHQFYTDAIFHHLMLAKSFHKNDYISRLNYQKLYNMCFIYLTDRERNTLQP